MLFRVVLGVIALCACLNVPLVTAQQTPIYQSNVVEQIRQQTEALVIIDRAVPDRHLFSQELSPGAEIKEIDSNADGLRQLHDILLQYKQLKSLHIISHADDGVLYLGNSQVSSTQLSNILAQNEQLQTVLEPGADVIFYGCRLAKGLQSQKALSALHDIHGLDIAASTNLTGNAKLGGDWGFEYRKGVIDSKIPFNTRLLQNYRYVLVTANFGGLGADDSGGTGFKSLTDANLVVSNKFTQDGTTLYFNDSTTTTTETFIIKADGVDAESFDVSAATLFAFNVNGITIDSTSTIVFKDKSGSTLQTMTLNGNKAMAQNDNKDIFTLFDNNTTSPVTGVAQIEFNIKINGCCANGNNFSNLVYKDITYTNVTAPSAAPTISGVTYDSSTGNLVVTGTNFEAKSGLANDVTVNKFTITGEGGGGSAYTLTSGTNIERDSVTQFTIPISGTDKLRVDALLNKNSTTADDGTTYNLAAADDFIAQTTSGNTAIATNAITVSNYANPAITSSTYDASTGSLVVTGTGFSSINGSSNDVVANTFTLTGDGGDTYTLTDTSNVDVTNSTTFTLTLSATDKFHVNGILNKDGFNAASGQAYNLAAADNWMAGGPGNVNIADSAATINISNVTVPAVTSATYNRGTGVLTVTGTNFVAKVGSLNDIDVTKLTLTGEGGTTHTLTGTNVEITSATSFSVTLAAADRLVVNGLLNKDGTQADDGATNYNLNAADRYMPATDSASSIADTTNTVTVSNTVAPTITSASYNGSNGQLVVTGTGFASKTGGLNDIDVTKLSFAGEGGNSYTLTTSNVEVSNETSFSLMLNATDLINVNGLLNKDGTTSGDGSTYNLAAAEDWQGGIGTSVTIADLTLNGVTVSSTQVPAISSATYDYSTGILAVTGTNMVKKSGTTNDVDLTKLSITGLGSGSRTLTTTNVEITDATSFSVTLNSADKTQVNALLDTNGTQASDSVVYNLNAAEDWMAGAAASATIVDATGNGITVSNVPVPTVTSAAYDFGTGVLVVTGTDFEAKSGSANDVTVNKITLTGEGGSAYTLTTGTNVEITNATTFSVTLSGTDKTSVNGLLNKDGTQADDNQVYNIAVADDFIANVTAGNTADTTGNPVTVSSVGAPTVTSATYDFSSGALVVTGTNFTTTSGANNDVDVTKLTLTGESGGTYTLTSSNVDITSETAFTVSLNAADKLIINGLLNKNGTSADSGTTYNLAAADNWMAAAAASSDIADLTLNGITVSNVGAPTVTSAAYNAGTGVLTVTGTNFTAKSGANNDVDPTKLTLTGEGGNTYVLTTGNVDVTNDTTFAVTLDAADKINVNGLLNKNGTQADDGATNYNLAAADNYMLGAAGSTDIADATNAVTVSNVQVPAVVSATYNAATGALVVSGTSMAKKAGANNDIDVTKLSLAGEGGNSYTLTSTSVELTSETAFSVTLNDTDKLNVNGLLNKDGTTSGDGSTYNLAAAEDWQAGAATNATIADLTTNGVTVSSTQIPTVTSATYDFSTGVLSVTGTNMVKKSGVTNDVDLTKLTLTGLGSGTRTLTTTNVEVTSATAFSVTLNSADKTQVNALLDTNGVQASDSVTYNLNAAEDWMAGAAASATIVDSTNGITVSNVPVPTVTSATYNFSTGALVVTGTDFEAKTGSANDVTVNKLTLTGEAGTSYTLTSGTNVEIDSATQFTVTLSGADKLNVDGLLNKNGTTADSGTSYNLAVADDFIANVTAGNTADTTGNPVTVSAVSAPVVTSATYDFSSGALVVTGSNFSSVNGSNNDVDPTKLTLTGDSGGTHVLTSTAVDVTNATTFTLTLNAADKLAIGGLLNKNGLTSGSGTTYNLAAADNWMAGGAPNTDIADLTLNGITVSNVTAPAVTSATYDFSSGALVVTGTNFVGETGSSNDVDITKMTLTGDAGGTYTLTSSNVEVTNDTTFSVTLNTADKLAVGGLLNKNGTTSGSGTTYNLAAADNWMAGADATVDIADLTLNGITVSNVAAPAITSATYNGTSGVLAVTGSNFVNEVGAGNDVLVSKITLTGEANNTHVLTSSNVEITSDTSFSVTLNDADKLVVNGLLNKDGTASADNTTYNLAVATRWLQGSDATVDSSDATNAITVSNTTVPSITSATYDASAGTLAVTAVNLVSKSGSNNDVDVTKLTLSGEAGASHTLTSSNIDVTSATAFSVTLNAADKLVVNGLLNKNGTASADNTSYNLAAAEDWLAGAATSATIADLTSNAITVSNVANPTVTSATYDASSGILAVTGTNFVSKNGATNDVDPTKLTITGDNGGTYTLTSSSVEVTSATGFSITLNTVDKNNVGGLLNKDGLTSDSGTTYNLAAADNWMAGADSTADIADLTSNAITVSNVTAPAITSALYDMSTGQMVITGTNYVGKVGTTNDVDPTKVTITGDGAGTYTLTTASVEITNSTQVLLTLNDTDKLHVNGLLNKDGITSDDGTTYNIAVADNWMTGAAATTDIADLTGNGITVSNANAPTITSATYDFSTGVLDVTGTNFRHKSGTANDVDLTKLSLKGEGSNSYTLTGTAVEITSVSAFSVTLSETDKINVNGLLNKVGTSADDSTSYNLAAADNWMPATLTATDIADATSAVTVSNVVAPTITSITYDYTTGVITVTGSNFVKLFGNANDIDISLFTFTGENGQTYTLTSAVDVEITSSTSFTITLTGADLTAVNALMTANGTTSGSGTTYNVAVADNWMPGVANSSNIADGTTGVTVSNVPTPTITSATYDVSTGSLVVTGTNFEAKTGSLNDVSIAKLTLKGEGGNSHTLTSSDVEITNTTTFSVTLNAADQLAVNGLLNKDGTASDDSTTYNLAAADDFIAQVTAGDSSDATASVTVSNVVAPTITSATYDASTGVLNVTGANFIHKSGVTNDIDISMLTFTGESVGTYTITSTSDIEVTSATSFSVTLSGTDLLNVNGLLNKNGTSADSGTSYNLAAADNWAAGAATSSDIADSTNGITVSGVSAPAITSAAYDATSGVLTVTGTNFSSKVGATNDVDISLLTVTGEAGAAYTIVGTTNVEVTSTTTFSLTLSGSDKTNIDGLLNKNGSTSDSSATSYNLAAADNWMVGAASSTDISDSTSAIAVSNVTVPTVTSSTYDAGTGVLTVTGSNFRNFNGSNNDVVLTAITVTGQSGNTYTLTSSSVDITDSTTFSVTLNAADQTGVESLFTNAGTSALDNTVYNLAAADNWMAGAAASTDISDTSATVSVSNLQSAKLTLSVNNTNIGETGGSATLTASLSRAVSTSVAVSVGLSYGGTATGTADYSGSTSINIAAGSTSGSTTVSAVSDSEVEVAETIIIDIISDDSSSVEEDGVQQQTITITDDDAALVTLAVNNSTISETSGTSTITATLDKATYENVVVSLSYSGTATSGTDYATPAGSITIAAGQTTGTATLTATSDANIEVDETIIVDITGVSGGKAGESGTQQQTVTITDDDTALVALSVNNSSMSETSGTSTVTATLDKATYENVVVSLGYTGTATSGTDYATPAGSITITAGQTSGTTTLAATSDGSVEVDETIIVDVTGVSGGKAAENGVQQQTVTITDDDTALVALSVNNSSVSETGGSSTVTATLDKVTYENVVVSLGYSGTATSGTDYVTPAGSITITAGQTSGSTTLSATADSSSEPHETIIVDVTGVTGGKAGESGTQQQTVTITDDDDASVTIALSSSSISETNGSSTITATLSQASFENVVVGLGYSGTAVSGTDYATPAGSITITAGQTTGTTTLSATGDSTLEGNETIIVDVTSVSGGRATENGTQQQTLSIIDDESTSVTLSAGVSSIVENGGSTALTASLSVATFEDVVIGLTYSGDAVSGVDYNTPASSITIAAGQTSASISLSAIDDPTEEAAESIIVDVASVSGGLAVESGAQQQTILILNDDDQTAPVGYSVSIDAININASTQTAMSFTFSNAEVGSTYNYTVADSQGITQGDTQARTVEPLPDISAAVFNGSGTVTAANQTVSNINVSNLADGLITLTVSLTDSAGNIGASASATVNKDTVLPTATLSSSASDPLNGPFVLDVAFSESVSGLATADFTILNGEITGVSGSGNSYTANVTPLEDGDVTITLAADAVQDTAGNGNTLSNSFTTQHDKSQPLLQTLSPANNETDVSTQPQLTLAFNENVTAGSSNNLIELKALSDDAVAFSVAASDSAVVISGKTVTVTLNTTLSGATGYYVNIGAGAFVDSAGNFFEGITANTNWQFTVKSTTPVTVADAATVDEDNSIAIDVLSNDAGVDTNLNPASVTVASGPANGSTSVNTANGVVTYTPNEHFNGSDRFIYTVSDLNGAISGETTVNITVNAVNDAPVAVDDVASVAEDESVTVDVLINDTDVDGQSQFDVASLKVVTTPTNGEAVVVDGKVTYTTAANFNGTDTFTYTIADLAGLVSNVATVIINVSSTNDAPVAVADSAVTEEEKAVTVNVVGNDVDIDGQIKVDSLSIVTTPVNGTASAQTDGTVVYTPNKDFFGTDSFSYTVTDDGGAVSEAALVTVTVSNINDAPVAQDDVVVLQEDSPHTINVTGNDTDIDGTITSVTVVSQPENGQVTIDTSNSLHLVYTPGNNFNGVDSFSYQVGDDTGAVSNVATVSLTVEAVNDAPIANNDSIQVNEETSVDIDVLANDSDIDGQLDNQSVVIVSQGIGGTAEVIAGGLIRYTGALNFIGQDTFVYQVSDFEGASATATVTVEVINSNDGPSAGELTLSGSEDTALQIVLAGSDPDGDTLIYTIESNPQNGVLSGDAPNLTYQPNQHFSGNDSFNYSVSDGVLTSAVATVNIAIGAVNDGPVADDQSVQVQEDGSVDITLSGSDVEGDVLSFTLLSEPASGQLSGTAPNLVYTPNNNFNGNDSFTFKTNDGALDSQTATVSIAVSAVNDLPVANPLTLSLLEDTSVSFTLSGSDLDGDGLTFNVLSGPANGQLNGQSPNLIYTPNGDFNGADSFTYEANDGIAGSPPVVVSINVAAINDAPVAQDDTVNRDNWLAFDIDVLANDVDVDGDTLRILGATVDTGSLSFNNNLLTYTPVNGFVGSAVINYRISDNRGGFDSARAFVDISVSDADLPVITPPLDVEVNADALSTKVDLGVATAVDRLGNPIPVSLDGVSTFFKPGVHTVFWRASDSEGRSSVASQLVKVNPLVSLDKDQTILEGFSVSVSVHLNGESPVYPLEIPFSVGGTAEPGIDHDLQDGSIFIDSGTEALLTFNVFADNIFEGEETVTIELSPVINRGAKSLQTVTISERNVNPKVNLVATQAEQERFVINLEDGLVVVRSQLEHPDANNQYNYTWSNKQGVLTDIDSDEATYTFDPTGLSVGVYHLSLEVVDSDDTSFKGRKQITMKLEQTTTVLTGNDTDADGVPDNVEGLGDGDNDGIPDYLDSINECNVLPETAESEENFLVEGDPGVCMRLGDTALGGQTGGTRVVAQDLPTDGDAQNIGGIFDFVAYGLPEVGQVYRVVLPQAQPIPANAIYRKTNGAGQWRDFVESATEQLWSSPGEAGYCPPPGDTRWEQGLNEGYWCVQLVIADGGPNDADGIANATIVDPGGVAVVQNNNTQPTAENDSVETRLNTPLTIDVLANDSDIDGDNLSISSANAVFGTVDIQNDQVFYQPAIDYFGIDTVVYGITDGQGGSGSATLTVTVLENANPVTVSDSAEVISGQQVRIDVLGNDTDAEGDEIRVIAASADNGVVTIEADYSLTYQSNEGFSGVDTIAYRIEDALGGEAIGTVSVTVSPATTAVNIRTTGGGALFYLLLLCLSMVGFCRLIDYPMTNRAGKSTLKHKQ